MYVKCPSLSVNGIFDEIPKFSLPWQQGSFFSKFELAIKLGDLENPLFGAICFAIGLSLTSTELEPIRAYV